jgi:hypothetical protein
MDPALQKICSGLLGQGTKTYSRIVADKEGHLLIAPLLVIEWGIEGH